MEDQVSNYCLLCEQSGKERAALKAEIEKWRAFYGALPCEYILPYSGADGMIKKQTRLVARSVGLEVE